MQYEVVVITDEMANAVCESADRLEALGVPSNLAVAIARVSAMNSRIAFNRGKEAGRDEVLKSGIVAVPLALDEQDEVHIVDYIDTLRSIIYDDLSENAAFSEANDFVREVWSVAYGRGLCEGFRCAIAPDDSPERKRTEATVKALEAPADSRKYDPDLQVCTNAMLEELWQVGETLQKLGYKLGDSHFEVIRKALNRMFNVGYEYRKEFIGKRTEEPSRPDATKS